MANIITQEELVELIGALSGVDGIVSKGAEIHVHVRDEAARDEVGAYLQKLRDEEDLDCSNIHLRL